MPKPLEEVARDLGAVDGRDLLAMGIYDDIQAAKRVLFEHERIRSFLSGLGYEGSTEKMVEQLTEDTVARKAERDQAREELAATALAYRGAVSDGADVATMLEAARIARDAYKVEIGALIIQRDKAQDAAAANALARQTAEQCQAELSAGTLLMKEQQRQRDDYKLAAADLRTKLESTQFQLHASRAEAERLRNERDAIVSGTDLGRISVSLDDDNRSAEAKTIRSACQELERLRKELAETEARLDLLDALEAAGVDNWPGYAEAKESLEDEQE